MLFSMLQFVMIINISFGLVSQVPVHPYWKTFENLHAQSIILYDVGKGQLEQTLLSRGLHGQGRPQGS